MIEGGGLDDLLDLYAAALPADELELAEVWLDSRRRRWEASPSASASRPIDPR